MAQCQHKLIIQIITRCDWRNYLMVNDSWADPLAVRSNAWVWSRLLAGNEEFESHRVHGCLSVVNVVFCEVEVSTSGWSLVQRSPTDCGMSECDREASIMRSIWPNEGSYTMENNDLRLKKEHGKSRNIKQGCCIVICWWLWWKCKK